MAYIYYQSAFQENLNATLLQSLASNVKLDNAAKVCTLSLYLQGGSLVMHAI
jgi:hypothetical protein